MQSACTITNYHNVRFLNILVQRRPEDFKLRIKTKQNKKQSKTKKQKKIGQAQIQASELVLLELFGCGVPASECGPLFLQHPEPSEPAASLGQSHLLTDAGTLLLGAPSMICVYMKQGTERQAKVLASAIQALGTSMGCGTRCFLLLGRSSEEREKQLWSFLFQLLAT